MDIGKKIKVARAEKGWTQQDLADKVNRTRSLIGNIEQSGKGNPETIQEIAAVLGIDLSDPSAKKKPTVEELQKENEALKKEVASLNDLVTTQKELIAQLKSNKK